MHYFSAAPLILPVLSQDLILGMYSCSATTSSVVLIVCAMRIGRFRPNRYAASRLLQPALAAPAAAAELAGL